MLRCKSTQLYVLIVFIYLFAAKGLSNVTPQSWWKWLSKHLGLVCGSDGIGFCQRLPVLVQWYCVLRFTFCSVTLTFKLRLSETIKRKATENLFSFFTVWMKIKCAVMSFVTSRGDKSKQLDEQCTLINSRVILHLN